MRPVDRPVRAAGRRPAGVSATQLFPGADPFTFTAPNLQYLMDSPTEFSAFSVRSFTVADGAARADVPPRRASHRRPTRSSTRSRATWRGSSAKRGRVYGEFPAFDGNTYTFIADYLPWANGDGMEHRNSTIVTCQASIRAQPVGLLDTDCARVLPLVERRADPAARRSSRSTSRTPTCRASCGSPKGSPTTTGRSCCCAPASATPREFAAGDRRR